MQRIGQVPPGGARATDKFFWKTVFYELRFLASKEPVRLKFGSIVMFLRAPHDIIGAIADMERVLPNFYD